MRTMCARVFWRRTQCALRFGGSKNVLSSRRPRGGLFYRGFLLVDPLISFLAKEEAVRAEPNITNKIGGVWHG
jgi:hypothetical protein